MPESRKNPKPEKWYSKPQTPKNPLHAVLGNLTERQTRLPYKDTTANLTKFYTQLWFWQQPKKHGLPKRLRNKNLCWLKNDFASKMDFDKPTWIKLTKTFDQRTWADFENLTLPKIYITRKRTFAKVTWPKDAPNNYKPPLTKTLTNGKNENWKSKAKLTSPIIWKPETKWTETKNLQTPPLKNDQTQKTNLLFCPTIKPNLRIKDDFVFALGCLTAGVTRAGAGGGTPSERKNDKA